MMKIKTFKGADNEYIWGNKISNSADAQFNRWAKDHTKIEIKDVSHFYQGNIHSLTILYEEPDDFIYRPSIFEYGKYFIDHTAGRLIRCDEQVDVSYMVKDFPAFNKIMKDHKICFADVYDSKFHITFVNSSNSGTISEYDSVYTEHNTIDVSEIIKDEYIPSLPIYYSHHFSISNNTGRYIINIKNHKLIRIDGNLDVSDIIFNYPYIGTNLDIPEDEDTEIKCSEYSFIYKNPETCSRKICNIREVVKSEFL